jgi:hypothetical protein
MSAWHRENPELAGTDADPWMVHESYRQASLEVRGISAMHRAGYASIDDAIADSTHVCADEDCRHVQRESASGRCRECGVGRLVEREP